MRMSRRMAIYSQGSKGFGSQWDVVASAYVPNSTSTDNVYPICCMPALGKFLRLASPSLSNDMAVGVDEMRSWTTYNYSNNQYVIANDTYAFLYLKYYDQEDDTWIQIHRYDGTNWAKRLDKYGQWAAGHMAIYADKLFWARSGYATLYYMSVTGTTSSAITTPANFVSMYAGDSMLIATTATAGQIAYSTTGVSEWSVRATGLGTIVDITYCKKSGKFIILHTNGISITADCTSFVNLALPDTFTPTSIKAHNGRAFLSGIKAGVPVIYHSTNQLDWRPATLAGVPLDSVDQFVLVDNNNGDMPLSGAYAAIRRKVGTTYYRYVIKSTK